MTTTHTPGPWGIQHEFDDEPSYIVAAGQDVAEVQTYADARLIAKAPEMLQLLREAFEVMETDTHTVDIRDWTRSAHALLAEIDGGRG